MLRFISTILLSCAASTSMANEALEKEKWKLGAVAGAAMAARTGAFTVVDACEKRFPDLKAEGAAVKSSFTSRNALIEQKLAALATRMAAKLQKADPAINITAVLAEADQEARQTAVEQYGKLITSALDEAKEAQRTVCQEMFGKIKDGSLDIHRIQKTANLIMQDAAIMDFLADYKDGTYQDRPEFVQATGSWLGVSLPVNVVNISATKGDKTVRIFVKSFVDLGDRRINHIKESDTTANIASWNDDVIRSEPTRVGTSQRLVQYVFDRKAKSVSMIYSGDSVGNHVLGDASAAFRAMRARYP